MKEYFDFIPFVLIVIVCTFILVIITTAVFNFFERKLKNENLSTALRVIKRILRTLSVLTGISFILYRILTQRYRTLLEDQIGLFVKICFIAILTVIAASVSRALFTNAINKIKRREGDTTKYMFFRSIVEVSIYILGFAFIMLTIPDLKGIATTMLSGAGILAVILGFAAQETFSNILAGILIIISEPFKLGDLIKVSDEMMGTVWDISLRHTIIKDFDNKMIVIPNSVINKEKVLNYHLGDMRSCERIEIGISYDSDMDLAKKIMAEEVENHPNSIDVRTFEDKENGVVRTPTKLIRLDESSVIVRVWAWAEDFSSGWEMRCDVIETIKKRFDAEGIVIPFPQRTISFLKKEESPDKSSD